MPLVRDGWDDRINRARSLSGAGGAAAPMLAFYESVLRAQKTIAGALRIRTQTGIAEADFGGQDAIAGPLLRAAIDGAPAPLAARAEELQSAGPDVIGGVVADYWKTPSDRDFFGKALLQPYLHRLFEAGVPLPARNRPRAENRCPRCGGMPQVSILEAAALESAGRQLQCADCLGRWPFRRVLCASCGEEDEARLGYFRTEEFAHLRIDSCDTCRHYLKSVDLGRLGIAVPLVDEVAGVALDAWAVERGYQKIELNLVGM